MEPADNTMRRAGDVSVQKHAIDCMRDTKRQWSLPTVFQPSNLFYFGGFMLYLLSLEEVKISLFQKIATVS